MDCIIVALTLLRRKMTRTEKRNYSDPPMSTSGRGFPCCQCRSWARTGSSLELCPVTALGCPMRLVSAISGRWRVAGGVKDSSDACRARKACRPDVGSGRRWIILQGGNRGIVLRSSAAGTVYGDLNNCGVAYGGVCRGGLTGDGVAGGDVGLARCAQRPLVSVVDAPCWAGSKRSSCQPCGLKCRRWYCAASAQ